MNTDMTFCCASCRNVVCHRNKYRLLVAGILHPVSMADFSGNCDGYQQERDTLKTTGGKLPYGGAK